MSEIKSPEEFEWYSKLASKLRRIEKGEFTVKEYLQQVYQKMGRCYLVQTDPAHPITPNHAMSFSDLKDLKSLSKRLGYTAPKDIVEPRPSDFDFASTEHLKNIQNMLKLDSAELHSMIINQLENPNTVRLNNMSSETYNANLGLTMEELNKTLNQ